MYIRLSKPSINYFHIKLLIHMKNILLLSIICTMFSFGCKKSSEDDLSSNTTNGSTNNNSNLRTLTFIFTPISGNISGKGNIFYTVGGVKTYVFGTSFNNQSWTGSNTSQETSVSVNVPPAATITYSFTSDTSPVFTSPNLSVKFTPLSGSSRVIIPPSTNLTGSFICPQ